MPPYQRPDGAAGELFGSAAAPIKADPALLKREGAWKLTPTIQRALKDWAPPSDAPVSASSGATGTSSAGAASAPAEGGKKKGKGKEAAAAAAAPPPPPEAEAVVEASGAEVRCRLGPKRAHWRRFWNHTCVHARTHRQAGSAREKSERERGTHTQTHRPTKASRLV